MHGFIKRVPPIAAAILIAGGFGQGALAEDALLEEMTGFTGTVLYLQLDVPGLVLGVTRNGEHAVYGFGETADGSGITPDGDTLMRIGSITKVFTGTVLAEMTAAGEVALTDTIGTYLDTDLAPGLGDIRLLDLAVHASGLPREVEREPGTPDDPFGTLTEQTYIDALAGPVQLFSAGEGGLYSNFAYDVLGMSLSAAAGQPYETLLAERILQPLGLSDTRLSVTPEDTGRLMAGHDFDGNELPDVRATSVMAGAGSLYSTANDMLDWLDWNLGNGPGDLAEARLLSHAGYLWRDGLSPIYGFDESGAMDAMGLGWVIMAPDGDRPLILQKAGGLQGMFVYHAFAPAHGVGAFVAINQFDFAAATHMATTVNALIARIVGN